MARESAITRRRLYDTLKSRYKEWPDGLSTRVTLDLHGMEVVPREEALAVDSWHRSLALSLSYTHTHTHTHTHSLSLSLSLSLVLFNLIKLTLETVTRFYKPANFAVPETIIVFPSEGVPCGVARFINIGNLITLIFPCPFLNCLVFSSITRARSYRKERERERKRGDTLEREANLEGPHAPSWLHASTGEPQPPKRSLFACE